MNTFNFIAILLLGLLIRIFLIFYGEWHDLNSSLPYTDVDYFVLKDGAKETLNPNSFELFPYYCNLNGPFSRATFRYTPILSFALCFDDAYSIPFGKLIFAAMDIGVYTLQSIISPVTENSYQLAFFWILNPFVIAISTRGNADSLVCFCILLCMFFLIKRKPFLAGIFYGLSVHIKLFPILYIAPIFFWMLHNRQTTARNRWPGLLGSEFITFGCVSGLTFVILTFVFGLKYSSIICSLDSYIYT